MSVNSIYTISSINSPENNTHSVTIKLDKNHPLYQGHFPEHPITPGAALLQILKELVENELQVKLMMQEASNVKFLTLVDPNKNSELIFDFKIESVGDTFNINNITTFLDGTVVLKCKAQFIESE